MYPRFKRERKIDQLEMKKLAARAALKYVKPDTIVGVGSGSTVNCFIEALGELKDQIQINKGD